MLEPEAIRVSPAGAPEPAAGDGADERWLPIR